MKQQRHSENLSGAATNQAESIGRMIEDMGRLVKVFDWDVGTEEERSQIYDPSDANYPILARTLAARRDNLKATIAALEARLSSIRVETEVAEQDRRRNLEDLRLSNGAEGNYSLEISASQQQLDRFIWGRHRF